MPKILRGGPAYIEDSAPRGWLSWVRNAPARASDGILSYKQIRGDPALPKQTLLDEDEGLYDVDHKRTPGTGAGALTVE